MSHRIALAAGLLGAALGSVAPAALAVTVYSNDFSAGAGAEWTDSTTATSAGEKFLGASANGFGNGTDTLTLTGLAPHTQVTVNFDLYIIQSWDGNGPAGGGPDPYGLSQNGNTVLLTTFANFTGGNTQSYSAATPNGLGFFNAPRSGAFDNGHLGFGTSDFGDATYRFSLTFASSASTLVLDFASLQNQPPGDEGWGLDNVSVITNAAAVPEPSTVALFGLGGLGLLAARRRRSRA